MCFKIERSHVSRHAGILWWRTNIKNCYSTFSTSTVREIAAIRPVPPNRASKRGEIRSIDCRYLSSARVFDATLSSILWKKSLYQKLSYHISHSLLHRNHSFLACTTIFGASCIKTRFSRCIVHFSCTFRFNFFGTSYILFVCSSSISIHLKLQTSSNLFCLFIPED